MELPIALKTEIEQYCTQYGQAAVVAAARQISQRYRSQSGNGKRLLTQEVEALAYAVVRMPATFGAVTSALESTLSVYDGSIHKVLDVGAGTGAGTWAAGMLLKNSPTFICIERENAMLQLGRKLTASEQCPFQAQWICQDLTRTPIGTSGDLVLASYVLNEMDSATRERVLNELWEKTEGVLLIVEPGTPEGFHQICSVRNQLLARGGHIIAPCPHSQPCFLNEEDWCHFTCRIARTRLHKLMKGGDAPYEDEKFSYLAVSRVQGRSTPARVLRHPLKEPGRISLRLCTQDGIREQTITKKQGNLFKIARKSTSGDTFPL